MTTNKADIFDDYFDNDKPKKLTNYERIKNMTIEEMAELLTFWECDNCCAYGEMEDCLADDKGCYNGIKKWLKNEVNE